MRKILVFLLTLVICLSISGCATQTSTRMLMETQNTSDQKQSKDEVVNKVMQYVEGMIDEEFVVYDDMEIKNSNFNGIKIDGMTYYYSLSPHQSFDPLSRGKVTKDKINVITIVDPEGDFPVAIYTIK
jgi:hypothetical protein